MVVAAVAAAPRSNPAAPQGPSLQVISTDWRSQIVAAEPPPPCPQPQGSSLPIICPQRFSTVHYQYTAHGIFKNTGGPGQVVVTFADRSEPSDINCKTVVKVDQSQTVEASCPIGPSVDENQPPTVTFS